MGTSLTVVVVAFVVGLFCASFFFAVLWWVFRKTISVVKAIVLWGVVAVCLAMLAGGTGLFLVLGGG